MRTIQQTRCHYESAITVNQNTISIKRHGIVLYLFYILEIITE
jgi:hypothetical protein